MSYLLQVAGAIALGIYTSAGIHYYSILIGRTKNDFVRILSFVLAMALFLLLPMAGLMFVMAAGPEPTSLHMKPVWRAALIFAWIGTFWIYAIRHWKTLQLRLGPPNI